MAERRDRNQSMRRRHFNKNLFQFKESLNNRPQSVQMRSEGSVIRNLRSNIQSEHPFDFCKTQKSKPPSPMPPKMVIKNETTRNIENINTKIEFKDISEILLKFELFQNDLKRQLNDINEELKILLLK